MKVNILQEHMDAYVRLDFVPLSFFLMIQVASHQNYHIFLII